MRCAETNSALRFVLGFGLALLATTGPARAHPHVRVTTNSEVIYAPDGSVTGICHAWSFDDMFSTYALHKKNGVYTREELAPLALTNYNRAQSDIYFAGLAKSGGLGNFRGGASPNQASLRGAQADGLSGWGNE